MQTGLQTDQRRGVSTLEAAVTKSDVLSPIEPPTLALLEKKKPLDRRPRVCKNARGTEPLFVVFDELPYFENITIFDGFVDGEEHTHLAFFLEFDLLANF